MIKKEYKYSALTGNIIGCAFEVHNTLGNGFQEVIYQRALEIEFNKKGTLYSREHNMPIVYNSNRDTSGRLLSSGNNLC